MSEHSLTTDCRSTLQDPTLRLKLEAVDQFTPEEQEHVDAPRRPQRTPDEATLGNDRIAAVTELSPEDLALVTSFIDALVTKTRLKVLASGS